MHQDATKKGKKISSKYTECVVYMTSSYDALLSVYFKLVQYCIEVNLQIEYSIARRNMLLLREYSICEQRIVYHRTTVLYVLEISYIRIISEAKGPSQHGVLPSLTKGKMAGSCVLSCIRQPVCIYCLP